MEITDHLGDAYFKVDRKKEAKLIHEKIKNKRRKNKNNRSLRE